MVGWTDAKHPDLHSALIHESPGIFITVDIAVITIPTADYPNPNPTTKLHNEIFELSLRETFEAYVCHVDTVDRFFVQRADSEIIQLSQEMQQYYQVCMQALLLGT